jgi:hypothetical protein
MVVVAMMMVMVALCERRAGNEHNHNEQQSLFHGLMIATTVRAEMPPRLLFWVTPIPQ